MTPALWAIHDRPRADEKRRRDKAKLEAELWSHLIDDFELPRPVRVQLRLRGASAPGC